jgi:hypothetical protein
VNLKLFLLAVFLVGTTATARAADVGVSVSVGQPGFYGRLDIGDFPRPQILYSQPRMIRRGPSGRPPVHACSSGACQELASALCRLQCLR